MTVLFVFAHQDDEFAVLAKLEQLVLAGAIVRCVYLTNGGYGNQSIETRNSESVRVLSLLGVAPSNIHFVGQSLGIPDGALHAHLLLGLRGLLDCIGPVMFVDEMYVPAWEGGHQDHDAAHLIGVTAAAVLGISKSTFQFSLYNGHGLKGLMFRVMSPLGINGPCHGSRIGFRKRMQYACLCLSYPSQWKSWIGLFPFVLLSYLIYGIQQSQPVSLCRVFEAPHPGVLLYERRRFLTSKEFDNARVQFVLHLTMSHLQMDDNKILFS